MSLANQCQEPMRSCIEMDLWPHNVLLELTPQKDDLFIIGDWNAKIGSQETPGVTGKYDLGVHNEAGKG